MLLKDVFDKQLDLDRFLYAKRGEGIPPNAMLSYMFLAMFAEISEMELAAAVSKKEVLDEASDVLHFFASIGNKLNTRFHYDFEQNRFDTVPCDTEKLYRELSILANKARSFKYWSSKKPASNYLLLAQYKRVWKAFCGVMRDYGVTPRELADAYKEKNIVNYKRQDGEY